MAVYVVTGKLGSGKTLAAVGRIRDYLNQGRRVATNLDLNLENLINAKSKRACVYRLPDNPAVADFEALGLGSDEFGEEKHGLIVLDECGQWLNTRNFQDKERSKLISYFIHARKLRWDVIFIIQHLNALDKQFRDMFAEHTVYCQRLDRLSIPLITWLASFIGLELRLPKMHRAVVKYGNGPTAMTVDTWWYVGPSLYGGFDTEQRYSADGERGLYQLLPPWYTRGRYESDWAEFKRKTQSILGALKLQTKHFFLFGLLSGVLASTHAGSLFSKSEPVAQVQAAAASKVDQVKPQKATERLNGLVITGHIRGRVTEYFFADAHGNAVDPSRLGYRQRWIDPCNAMLINDRLGDVRYVQCSAGLDVHALAGAASPDEQRQEPPFSSWSAPQPIETPKPPPAKPKPEREPEKIAAST